MMKYKIEGVIDSFINNNYSIHVWESDNICHNDTTMYNGNVLYYKFKPVAIADYTYLYINKDARCKATNVLEKLFCENKQVSHNLNDTSIKYVETDEFYDKLALFGRVVCL